LGRTGGVIPLPDEIASELTHMARSNGHSNGNSA
jgi:hypothetical protein